jgi:hypothetical protein
MMVYAKTPYKHIKPTNQPHKKTRLNSLTFAVFLGVIKRPSQGIMDQDEGCLSASEFPSSPLFPHRR